MSDNAVLAALARLEAGQEKLQSDLTRLENGQDKLRVDLMTRMVRLQEALSGIRDDIKSRRQ
jgi:hypothetical protein